MFPDCAEAVRSRVQSTTYHDDEWQLELLCNIGAAEILMPSGYRDLETEDVGIDNLLVLRTKFDVSTEAMLIRIAKLTSKSCAVFSSARLSDSVESCGHRIDYSVPSRTWQSSLPREVVVESETVLDQCTAIGFTAKGHERWGESLPELSVQCVGIPPFPGNRYPRVAGVVTDARASAGEAIQIQYLFGDATEPRGEGSRIIAHIVNDATPTWGAGFGKEIGRRWRSAQDDFREWAGSDIRNLVLGSVRLSQVEQGLGIVHMVAQHGYGPSTMPRIRYGALADALDRLEAIASDRGASVHMPRIGAGHAGGNWELISELIDERLVRRGVPVFVYALPGTAPAPMQSMLPI